MQLTLLTWKWPGCLGVFAPALLFCQLMSSNGQISRYKCLIKYLIFLQPQAFRDAFYAPNSFSAGALPRTPLGELGDTHSPFPTLLTPTASRSRRPEFHFPKVGNPSFSLVFFFVFFLKWGTQYLWNDMYIIEPCLYCTPYYLSHCYSISIGEIIKSLLFMCLSVCLSVCNLFCGRSSQSILMKLCTIVWNQKSKI